MDPYLQKSIGLSSALLAGFITKKVSKNKGSTTHKILSPVAATIGGFGAMLAMGEGEVTFGGALRGGLEFGMAAVFGQSMFRGVKAQIKGQF